MKKAVKNIIGCSLSSLEYPILVNSYGRSGSTVLTNSIVRNILQTSNKYIERIAFRTLYQQVWNLDVNTLKNGIVYKTHDYPPQRKINKRVRMIYTFASPVDVVLSLIRFYNKFGEKWMKLHYQHLNIQYRNFGDLVDKDVLQLEKHLNVWLKVEEFPIAFVKYESMWNYQDDLSDFLGFRIFLPPFKKRKAKQLGDDKLISRLEDTYSSLIKKTEELEAFFTNKN